MKIFFSYCEDLATVSMDSSTLEIGTYSFYDCTSLVNVSIAADSEDDSLELVISYNGGSYNKESIEDAK